MVEFSKDNLITIEKHFDIAAGNVMNHLMRCDDLADSLSEVSSIDKSKLDEHRTKMFYECLRTFDEYRTISAICESLRKQREGTQHAKEETGQ
jgi:hypothetical protein